LDSSRKRRSDLVMPPAQMNDQDIRDLSKMGFEPDESSQDPDDPTKALLSKYTPTPTPHVSSGSGTGGPLTPRGPERTPARPDVIRTEAENLRALTEASTPLIGGENVPLHPSDFSGATPKRLDIATPNTLATPFRTPPAGILTGGSTPRNIQTPRRTPLRDELSINNAGSDFGDEEENLQQKQDTQSLLKGLASLPKPTMEIRVQMPDLEDLDMVEVEDDEKRKERKGTSASIIDAEDILKKQRERQKTEEDTAFRLRSEVLRRELPRPYQVNSSFSKIPKEIEAMKGKETDLEVASELIKAEMVTMMTKDAIDFPSKSIKPPNKKNVKYDKFTEAELKSARKLLDFDVAELDKTNGTFSYQDYESTFVKCAEDLIYLPHMKKFSLMSLTKSDVDKTRAFQFQYESVKSDLDKQAKKSKNIVNHLQVYLGGYQKVTSEKERSIHELQKQIAEARIELSVFKSLKEREEKSIPLRLEAGKNMVEAQRGQENELQIKFANLVNRKNELLEQTIKM